MRYEVQSIKLQDWSNIAVSDMKENEVICHVTCNHANFEEREKLAEEICEMLNKKEKQ